MSSASITPKTFFSLRTDVKQNAHYITDFQILYSAGSVLIMQNYYEKRQKYINLYERSIYLEMIAVSQSRKLAAIIENGDKGQILVLDLKTLKKKRTLNLPPDSKTNRFETIAFTHDDVYILAVTGEPDWNLVTYNWGKGKVTGISKAIVTSNPSATVTQIHCSPTDTSEIFLIGQSCFRLLTMTETVWRQYGFQKADQINITSATWLSGIRVLCGTGDGKLFFIENGDFKGVYSALSVNQITLKEKDETSNLGSSSLLLTRMVSEGEVESEDIAVRALISFSKGFAYSCRSGMVHLFEKQGSNKYKKRNLYQVVDNDLLHLPQYELNLVKHLSINASQDQLLATTNRAQLYTVRLWGPDINVAPTIPFKHLGEPLHHGPINGLSTCLWKPIFATAGELDQTIRIWNYETETVQIVKHYSEKILSIHLHPTGNFIAVCVTDKIIIAIILINDIQPFRTLPIKNCDICRFSYYGHYFAITHQGVIEIYGTVMMNNVFSFKGHIGKINAMKWVMDDKRLATCSSEGEIFVWDVVNGTLLREILTPEVNYFDIGLSSDAKYIYAVGSDGYLKQFVEGNLAKAVKFGQNYFENIQLNKSNLLMFLTGDIVLSVEMPLTDPPEYSSFHYHASKITKLKLSIDDQTLITISTKGAVIIWKLNFAEAKSIQVDKNFMYSTEVLINKRELQEKISKIKDLSQKLYELELGQVKEIRDTENNYCDKMKEIHGNYTHSIEELREKIQQTEADQEEQLIGIKKEIDNLKEKQRKEKADMVENYTGKLLVEYEKVRSLDALKEETIVNFERRVAELEQSKEEETNQLIRVYEQKLVDINNLLKQVYEENTKSIAEHEKVKQQLEEDTDREIVETKAKYEGLLKEEREQNVFLRDESTHMRKKHAEAQKERDEIRAKLESLQGQILKYQSNIYALEKDVADLKAEIVERDTAIAEKDETIFSLKKKIQELDKFKFVLDYKIKELRKEIDPKDREIREKKEQIADMDIELDNLKKINSSLELQLTELKEKINGTEREVSAYEKKNLSGINTMRQIRADIYSLYQAVNDFKKLKDGIKDLYHKYHECDIGNWDQFGESDLQRELLIQREFLEKTIKVLKSTLKKGQKNQTDPKKVIQDNVVLLEELNKVRKELKEAHTTVVSLEALIGVKGKRVLVPSEAFKKLQQTLEKQNKIKNMYQKVIDNADEETEELNKKVKKMQEKLRELVQSGLN